MDQPFSFFAAGLESRADHGQNPEMVEEFRKSDDETPIILMGYYNPIYVYPADKFLSDARKAGVDGLIIVDLPPETDRELCLPARDEGIEFHSAWPRRQQMKNDCPQCCKMPAVFSIMCRLPG